MPSQSCTITQAEHVHVHDMLHVYIILVGVGALLVSGSDPTITFS